VTTINTIDFTKLLLLLFIAHTVFPLVCIARIFRVTVR